MNNPDKNLDTIIRLNVPYTPAIHTAHIADLEKMLAREDLTPMRREFWTKRKRRAELLFKRFSKLQT